ncbi:MAG: hypothetical protein QOH95_1233 [Gaiellaceae bacterium]|nr:hypothetical protein [Gaiellaceae bacterium]
MSHPDANGSIVGTIRDGDGQPVAGALVRAFVVRMRAEEPLGTEATTDPDGRYSISTGPDNAEGAAPNVRVAVFDEAGHEVASSPVRFGVETAAAIDLTVPNGSSRASEFERHVAALAPALQGMPLSDANAGDSTFLVGATGIPAPDLKGLVEASVRAAGPSALPVEAFYAWHRQGLPLEPAELLLHPTDDLVGALRAAVDTGVVPARIGDDLEGIRARIEQLKRGLAPDEPAPAESAVSEQVRELPDVTIRVREPRPGYFEADFTPTDPNHIARGGYKINTSRGLRGRTFTEVLDRAEANWRQNYPSS